MLISSENRHATEWSPDAVAAPTLTVRTRVAQTGTLVRGVLMFEWLIDLTHKNHSMHVVYIYIHMCENSNTVLLQLPM